MRFYLHVVLETDILEITVAVSLLLLSEVYSTRLSKPRSPDDSGRPISEWEPRSGYRLEFGRSPANRVQTWTYSHPLPNPRTTVLDSDNHYWMYFRTIQGEEITLDCCSFAYGMTGYIDASPYLTALSEQFGWEVSGARDEGQRESLRQFMQQVQGTPLTPARSPHSR
ncbi:hypothetical protein AGABI1DRAFT_86733, partial [Agaricus bisporus var. burnettii JB137-S8]